MYNKKNIYLNSQIDFQLYFYQVSPSFKCCLYTELLFILISTLENFNPHLNKLNFSDHGTDIPTTPVP